MAEDVGGVGGKTAGGRAAERRFLYAVPARGRIRRTGRRRGCGGSGEAAAAALEVPEFQRRKNGKRAKPKCPRGAPPRMGGPALPHPRLAAPPVPSPLPRSQPGTSGRCQGLWHLRVSATVSRVVVSYSCNIAPGFLPWVCSGGNPSKPPAARNSPFSLSPLFRGAVQAAPSGG